MWAWIVEQVGSFIYWIASQIWSFVGWAVNIMYGLLCTLAETVYQWAYDLFWRLVQMVQVWASSSVFWQDFFRSVYDVFFYLWSGMSWIGSWYMVVDMWFPVTECLVIAGVYFGALAVFLLIKNILRFIPTMG